MSKKYQQQSDLTSAMHQAVERRKDQEKKFVDPKVRWKAGLADQRRRRTKVAAAVLAPVALLSMLGGAMAMGFKFGAPSALSDALAAPTTTETVRLDGQGLDQFPEDLKSVTALKLLSLDNNSLSSLPVALGEMKGLTSLSVSYNQLATLPPEIGHLEQLQELQLKDNSLASLPDSLCGLSMLTTLNLTGNRLTDLPAGLGDLSSLKVLQLRGNRIAALPPSFARLSRLEELDLSGNPISELPSPASFPNLRKLKVKGSKISPSVLMSYKSALSKVSISQ